MGSKRYIVLIGYDTNSGLWNAYDTNAANPQEALVKARSPHYDGTDDHHAIVIEAREVSGWSSHSNWYPGGLVKNPLSETTALRRE